VKASYESVHGTIVSHWTRSGDTLTLNVTVPVNTQAQVFLPATGADGIRESNQPLDQHSEIPVQPSPPGCVVLTIGSGDYHFTARGA